MNGGGVRFSRRAEEDVNEGWVSGVVRRHHDAPPVHPLPNEWNDDYAEDDAYEEEEGKGARDRAPGPAPARSSRVPRAPVELSPPAQAPPETFKQGGEHRRLDVADVLDRFLSPAARLVYPQTVRVPREWLFFSA